VRINLAVANAEQGERGKAEQLLQDAIQDCRRTFKTIDHPNILSAQYHLARLIEQDGDLETACKRYLSIVTSQRKI
jgi:predicted GNAT family N-acyltransferase